MEVQPWNQANRRTFAELYENTTKDSQPYLLSEIAEQCGFEPLNVQARKLRSGPNATHCCRRILYYTYNKFQYGEFYWENHRAKYGDDPGEDD